MTLPLPPPLTPSPLHSLPSPLPDVEMSDWQTQADYSRLRDMSYTLALNYTFGPKYARSTEHQIYSKGSIPGVKHIVNTEVRGHPH